MHENSIEFVRSAIETAFAGLPVPSAGTLVEPQDDLNRGSAVQIQRDLQGKTWQDLAQQREYLAKEWAGFCYLAPEAYRYYLPALLMAALEDFTNESSFAHSVVYRLHPSFWSLYYLGEDHEFRAQQSLFTPAQYAAVSAFLGLAFDWYPRLRHWAARALYWGWNGVETRALQAVQQYYREMSSFDYPKPEGLTVARLMDTIRSGFADTPYPGDNALCGSGQGDEPATYAMELRGRRWQTLHPEFLARNDSALSFLTDGGFRYFLPAFLLSDLIEYESNASPVFHLTYGWEDDRPNPQDPDFQEALRAHNLLDMSPPPSERPRNVEREGRSRNRFAGFTVPEREAIIAYLEYKAEDEDYEYEAPTIRAALEEYWRPSLEG